MSAVEEVRRLLGGLDPVPSGGAVDAERMARDLVRIRGVDRSQVVPSKTRPRRRLVMAAAAVAVMAVAGSGVAVEAVRRPQPVFAATPAALSFGPPVSAEPAGARLRQLAQAAVGQRGLARPAGAAEYLESSNWFLNSSVSGGRATSAVVPQQWQSWRMDDDAGRVIKRDLPPVFASDADRRRWQDQGGRVGSAQEVTDFPAGEFRKGWQGAVPTDVPALRRWLDGGTAHEAPVQYLEDVAELAGARLLSPAQRATVLRLLAELPGMTVSGTVTDRAGRRGEAFSMTSDAHGLPAQYTIIVASDTGALLGYEEMLTSTAGKLNVKIPAVIAYRSYLVARYAPMPG